MICETCGVAVGCLKAKTTTALMSSTNPTLVGQSITYTATITPAFGGAPTGTVTFKQGSTTVATVPLSGGTAIFTTSYAAGAILSIKAIYSGDGNFQASSAAINEVVKKYSVTLGLTSNMNPSTFRQTVTFTATLSTAGPSLDGQVVTFRTSDKILGAGTISGGVATVATSALNVGRVRITAIYAGDPAHTAVSAAITQTVH